jgi:hypothetical protein
MVLTRGRVSGESAPTVGLEDVTRFLVKQVRRRQKLDCMNVSLTFLIEGLQDIYLQVGLKCAGIHIGAVHINL